MTSEPLFVVWLASEGLPMAPCLCTDGDSATRLVVELSEARICHEAALLPCCRNDAGHACPRDAWTDDLDHDRAVEILHRAAIARRIPWPSDRGQVEPEHSTLPDGRT